jgi:hypothetical protein
MKNFHKRTLLKIANVQMGLVYMPTTTLTWVVNKAKTTKQANADFLFLLTNKEYVRIFENWGEKNWELATTNANELMLSLRKRV